MDGGLSYHAPNYHLYTDGVSTPNMWLVVRSHVSHRKNMYNVIHSLIDDMRYIYS